MAGVYTLNDTRRIYVGESRNAAARMLQHKASDSKHDLKTVRVIIDDTFNKSVCLDLESWLIRLFAGDGHYTVLNRNSGITNANYFDRWRYQDSFNEAFEKLREDGIFTRRIPEIENGDLFKLSPFKALTRDQAVAAEDIVTGLFDDIEAQRPSTIVIQGDPGTGKTIMAIFLIKLLRDIAATVPGEIHDTDSMFSEFFAEGHADLLTDFRIGLVIPQQSLRTSVQSVFRKTAGLYPGMVMTPFQAALDSEGFDLLIVDEAHRLNQRANQSSGMQNRQFIDINTTLFGADDTSKTQLDWIKARSTHQIFLVDEAQSVRPADLPAAVLASLQREAREAGRLYPLTTQMRIQSGSDYVGYIRTVLGGTQSRVERFPGYDLRLFDSLADMHAEIRRKDESAGLSRLVAGYAWEWSSKTRPESFDIELDGCQLRWNKKPIDWINSPGSINEVGSIHTVQGYDLNYAGVIIGNDLRYDPKTKTLFVDRDSYRDTKGKENNRTLGITYTDNDLLRFITNIYGVLLTRGMRGTYVYVCDPALRDYMSNFLPGTDI